MNITITLNTDNAAFEDDPGAEVARILRRLANDLALQCQDGTTNLRDVNGNKVGICEIVDDSEPMSEEDKAAWAHHAMTGE